MRARRRRRRSALAALGLASALSLGVALGAPADLDPGFGRDGRATANAGDDEYANALAVQPDGRIVVAAATSRKSNGVVFRLNPDGSPDTSFDGDGARLVDIGPGSGSVNSVALQPDGGIVVAGPTYIGVDKSDAGVFRLDRNGSPDLSFDTDGATTIDNGGDEQANAVALQPDGKIVVAGSGLGGKNAMVWRLSPTGAPDPSFGTAGTRAIDLGGTEEVANAVAIQPDGNIVVAGYATLNGVTSALAVRLTPTGAPDLSFGGGDSIVTFATGAGDRARAVAIQPDGRIVMAGRAGLNDDAVAYRLTPGGAPDPSFGTGGIARLDSGGKEDAYGLAIQSDGKIVVAGETRPGDAVVYRLRPDGTRDATFGDDGELALAGGLESAQALALQADGKMLLAGDNSATDTDVLVYRLLGDSQTPEGLGGTGRPPEGLGATGGAPEGLGATGGPLGPTARPATAARCAGERATITGTARRDRIRGTRGRDVIAALGGNDVIRGLGGNDLICAGAGNDIVLGGRGRDRLIGGAGRDRLMGGAGLDRLVGGPGRDTQVP